LVGTRRNPIHQGQFMIEFDPSGSGRFLPPRTSCSSSTATYWPLVALYTVQAVFTVTLILLGVPSGTAELVAGGQFALDLLITKVGVAGLRRMLAALFGSGPGQLGWLG
jgi:hypothetical protein